jgi:hypothetical protein
MLSLYKKPQKLLSLENGICVAEDACQQGANYTLTRREERSKEMTHSIMFIYGFLGAFTIDFEKLYSETMGPKFRASGFPKTYRRTSYWIFRLTHPIFGGFLAIAWGQSFPGTNPLTLMAVGGGAGVIIERFGKLIANKF